ncbi:MAG: hypothetical protein J6S63_10760, partial [Atopobiaceae bacterium]|nr:hypothetical protein [Atopobiaceae bacterium]
TDRRIWIFFEDRWDRYMDYLQQIPPGAEMQFEFKDTFHAKAKMLRADDAEALIGHGVGGVCPFGVNDGCDVYLDESLRRCDVVYPAAGDAASAVRLTVDELEQACAPCGWVDVSKLPASA